jgi:hypothetical protein
VHHEREERESPGRRGSRRVERANPSEGVRHATIPKAGGSMILAGESWGDPLASANSAP